MVIAARTREEVLTRTLLRCGGLAGPLFVATYTVEGATRADYDPLRHPVSSLAIGPGGWVQAANFIVTGSLYGACAAGLWRAQRAPEGTRAGPVLVGAAAAGLLGAGLFTTDPVSGYPPGTPDTHLHYSSAVAALHDVLSVPTFLGLPAAAMVYGRWFLRRGNRGWALYSAASAAGMLTTFGLASAAFNQAPALVNYGGLLQRLSVTTGFTWLSALALRTLDGGRKGRIRR